MAALTQRATRTGANSYRLSIVGYVAGSTVYWWVNGKLQATGKLPFLDIAVAPGDNIDVDVFDSSTDAPAPTYPSRAVLEWENNSAKYVISEYVDSTWTDEPAIRAGVLGAMRRQTRPLEDDQIHLFRVTGIGEDLNIGIARQFSIKMVRKPDPPVLTITYDGSSEVEASF